MLETGFKYHQMGNLAEAEALYTKILEIDPENTEANHLLGVIRHHNGDFATAIDLIGNAVQTNPGHFVAHNNLGNALSSSGNLVDAEKSFRKALKFKPDYAMAHNNLGNVLKDTRRYEEARKHYARAISLDGNYAEALANMGGVLLEAGKMDEAEQYCRRALDLNPAYAIAHTNLGNVLIEKGAYDEAERHHRKAVELSPGDAGLLNNLGNVLKVSRQFEEACEIYSQALAINPNDAKANYNLGMTHMAEGNLVEGFKGFEWRWKVGGVVENRDFAGEEWNGNPLDGRTLLVHAEQGLGDTINFCRYLPILADQGGHVAFECQPSLIELVSGMDERLTVFARGKPIPHYDLIHAPLLSLPRLVGTTIETIPADVPYLEPGLDLVEKWTGRLSEYPGLKIGLSWRGNPVQLNDRNRSTSLEVFQRHFKGEGMHFFSLQKDRPAEEAKLPDHFIDLGQEFENFSDTAAAMKNLDLVISVCTAVTHMAGAVGAPTWTLLSNPCDWRWMLDREDTPWYPTMRLIRKKPGESWDGILARVAKDLKNKDWKKP